MRCRKRCSRIGFVIALGLSASLSAQAVSVSVRAKTKLSLFALGESRRLRTTTVAAGKKFGTNEHARVVDTRVYASLAATTAWDVQRGGSIKVSEGGSINGFGRQAGVYGAATGPHEYAVTFKSTQQALKLAVFIQARSYGGDQGPTTQARHEMEVSLGKQRLVLAKTGQIRQWKGTVSLPLNGVEFVVRSQGFVSTTSQGFVIISHSGALTLQVTPFVSCTPVVDPLLCGGGFQLVNERFDGRINWGLIFAPRSRPAFAVLGTRSPRLRLPGSQCLLLADPAILIPLVTNSSGSAAVLLPRPPRTSFRLQMLSVASSGAVLATPAHALTCR